MKKFTIFINGSDKVVNLQDSFITTGYSYVFVKRVTVFWEYYNFPQDVTNALVVSNVNYTVYRRYHTFDNLVQYFSDAGLMLSKVEYNGKCTINPGVTTGAQVSSKLSSILGLKVNITALVINNLVNSEKRVNINQGLEFINISCNLVNSTYNVDTNVQRSTTITSIAVTTKQPLFGSVSEYYDTESRIPIVKGSFTQLNLM
jgi:hypothetical protein